MGSKNRRKCLARVCARRRKKIWIIFPGDMCVGDFSARKRARRQPTTPAQRAQSVGCFSLVPTVAERVQQRAQRGRALGST